MEDKMMSKWVSIPNIVSDPQHDWEAKDRNTLWVLNWGHPALSIISSYQDEEATDECACWRPATGRVHIQKSHYKNKTPVLCTMDLPPVTDGDQVNVCC